MPGRIVSCFKWCPLGYMSILDLLRQDLEVRVFHPTQYLSASHEVFGITLIITWALTLAFHPEQIFDHPARPIIGSFNPCFGWDYPPASYIALTFCSVNVYLTWRYAWLELTRTELSTQSGTLSLAQQFASVSAVVLALASNCWLLLWVVGPEDGNWWGHTALFVFYAAGSYLTCLGNFLEVRFSSRAHVIERQHKIFIGCYTFAVVFLPFCYATNLALYKEGQPPALPPWVTQASDVVWLGCVMFITSFTPPDVPLRQTMELATERDVEAQRML